ncbi:MAG: UDP-N-acetylmuramoyl-L-alanine--D-glutamate ligase [Gammaproteobacteria bacterium]|nr:UDP-N-acetylmuramoyl-L-alanine--D-glutamate ligase [Gammaproteobacteria bacterium]
MNAREKSTLVLGLGRTGYSVVAHLAARGDAGRITAADSRERAPCAARVRERFPRVRVITGRLPFERMAQFDRVVASPGVEVARAPAVRVIGDIELFAESARAPVIAITGSNGKSTVTTLVADMLAAAGKRVLRGGNLGTPALELLEDADAGEAPDFYVLELSSFQLENTYSLSAAAASVLNISADHLDRHGDLANYTAIKARVLRGASCVRVLNRDDPASRELLRAHPDAVTFGLGRPNARHYGISDEHFCRGEARLAPLSRLRLQGAHNAANALAALALAEAAGVAPEGDALEALLAHRGLEHRCELAAEIGGVKWINDSKGTNVGASLAALGGLRGELIWIGGGIGKGADFTPLRAPLRERARAAVLFGRDAAQIETAIAGATEVLRARDLAHAVEIAAARARAGQAVVFSPACSSFDMFKDYAERGRAFKKLAGALAEGGAR